MATQNAPLSTPLSAARTAPPPHRRHRHDHAHQPQETILMPGKQAKVVTPPMLKRMLRHVSRSSFPARDRVMILLSVKAGLRACEIAGLDWSMVLEAQVRVSGTIHVR